jgi:type II secretory pathway pseudopilin PulG
MKFSPAKPLRTTAAFTLVEIAICLAIIGVALVAIIGVLPIGMNTQRDNREDTIIGQDASVLLEAIRSGARGMDDLTNYVFAITNSAAVFNPDGSFFGQNIYGFTNGAPSYLTNGLNIIGLLSTPEFTRGFGGEPIPNVYHGGVSNHIVAYVRALSGIAAEKPPQNNDIMRDDAFSYRVLCVNAPMAVDSNSVNQVYNRNLGFNTRELRMTFLWPLLPNGNTGKGRQTFRVNVAGQTAQVFTNGLDLYFYQPQSFTNAPPVP